ncbi:DNA-binding response regulator [Rufibacter immobilis]|uniref:DNA-binding response regulator n=1 Tax=Rufibacter immobilis TaxID=1348778 RepID=A0A3M9N485_9BACT|nr:response regulator transcription factor [Rufibacter immobilis]RNI32023.1 DNA-binding response regulator [Rufibacter immobilis]
MTTPYRLLLIEDDLALVGSLLQALNKQNLYSQRIEIQSFSYTDFEARFGIARNSTRELIVMGGKAALDFNPDPQLLKTLLAQMERTHIYILTPSKDGEEILRLWQPGVKGVLERSPEAHRWLVQAIQKVQFVQQTRTYSRSPKPAPKSFWKRLFS